ncbi:MAG: CRISPR-associated protein Cas4 [Verrucomicrobiae bacterium]|nr:CRISPR-associated protein Cas4 [Verrucomicrobiae bacterium]
MAELPPVPALPEGERERIPLSALNQYLFCPRRAALIHVQGIFTDNQHTLRGDIVHEHADLAGYEVVKGVTLLRALTVWTERLGLNGRCDIVEQRADGSMFPVEFKLGKRRRWENDDVQLCAQAICLEEMFGIAVPRGAIFHADSKRRREVEFSPELRARTEETARQLHKLLREERTPPAVYKEACEECSLYPTCLPKATGDRSHALRLAKQLFQI